MSNSTYRWVIVAAGGLLGCVAIGGMFSLPVFLQPMARETGWSVTGISSAMTIGFLAMAFTSMIWGTLSDRFGPLPVVLTGSVVLAASLALASQATSLLAFQFVFGALVGAATAAIFAPMMACVTGWFDTHRSLAVSLVSAGMGMAPMTMSPLAAWLISHHDWRTAMLIVSGVVGAIMIPVSFLVRRPPALQGDHAEAVSENGEPPMSLAQALRSPQFIILIATNFFCCATHSGPIIHTVSYAVTCGIPMVAAVTIYSVEGLAGMGGRIAFGLLGDRFGAKRVLVLGLLAQAFGALGYVFVRELAAFYAVAAIFGFIYAGTMPLYSVLIRENFPLRMMGTVIGGTAMAGSLGMATGPLAGGLIYDTFASYTWLYVGSWAVGIGAFLIMMTFRPMPAVRPTAVPAPA
ncbi:MULTISPECIES: MFS transporter [Bradyrhizobium]|uniref:MFS family permease n=1 Tax=Bradyrhizobium elkanii TaxID=29448 RepID=A0A8I1YHB0_BRAEL|nr:MFS transporter [Bradyrhizobium elkanii]MBP1298151.1 MFS family permease [Bradyrhizobium elkanii]MCP1970378.1 MFS family permease [Bradyrhizobium elkanii]MCS4108115.1 MFS family permease [Bradyrhizobium elkanii]WLA36763.1 MFS transporter [Bradyrhizobium elkanii]